MVKAIYIKSEDTADHIKTFWFEPQHPLHYIAGQFTELFIPSQLAGQPNEKQQFTLSSSPTDRLLSITTKLPTDYRPSSFKQTLAALKPGSLVGFAEPMGDFVLPKDTTIPLVFIGGGIGITPFHSMSKWLIDTGEKRSIRMLYAANRLEEIAFRTLFETVAKDFQIILSTPPASWSGLTGRLTAKRIAELIPGLNTQRIYLSGPEPMVEKLGKDLESLGITKDNLVIDYFPGYLPV